MKVCILADKYLCTSLMNQARNTLAELVRGFTRDYSIPDELYFTNVVQLVRLAYTYMAFDVRTHRQIRRIARWGMLIGPLHRELYVGRRIKFPVVSNLLREFPEVERDLDHARAVPRSITTMWAFRTYPR